MSRLADSAVTDPKRQLVGLCSVCSCPVDIRDKFLPHGCSYKGALYCPRCERVLNPIIIEETSLRRRIEATEQGD